MKCKTNAVAVNQSKKGDKTKLNKPGLAELLQVH